MEDFRFPDEPKNNICKSFLEEYEEVTKKGM